MAKLTTLVWSDIADALAGRTLRAALITEGINSRYAAGELYCEALNKERAQRILSVVAWPWPDRRPLELPNRTL